MNGNDKYDGGIPDTAAHGCRRDCDDSTRQDSRVNRADAVRVCRATVGDEGQLRELWKTVFGDGDRFLDSFFKNLFRPEECLVARSGDTVTSMLFMLEAVLSGRTGDRSMRYIYACATHPDHRRQGLMGLLLDEAVRLAGENGLELALVPENLRSAEYYGRFGFTVQSNLYMRKYPAPAAAKDVRVWQAVENQDATKDVRVWQAAENRDATGDADPVKKDGAAADGNQARLLRDLRQHFWQGRNAVLWPEAHLKVVLGELVAAGGEFLVMNTGAGLPDGYALAIPDGDMIGIVECASVMGQDETTDSLRNHYKTHPTLFSLADGVADSCAGMPYALFRVHSVGNAGPAPHSNRNDRAPYLNLALDF